MHTKTDNSPVHLGVVIPVHQASEQLQQLIEQFARSTLPLKIVVVNGGRTELPAVDNELKRVSVIVTERHGRGYQLRLGTRHLNTPWYLMLHADSLLTDGWEKVIKQFITDTPALDQAGYFDFQLNTKNRKARMLEYLVLWRCRILGLPYGDQGLLIPARLLASCGGVPDIPLMEDVQLARKLSRRRLKRLGMPLQTSAQHYTEHGFLKRSAQNLVFLCLYFVGVKPETLHRWYYR